MDIIGMRYGYFYWILYFLDKLNTLTLKLDEKYGAFKAKGGYLNERQKKIRNYIQEDQPVKLADIAKTLDAISINTIKKDLQYMKREKLISSVGRGKGTVYIES